MWHFLIVGGPFNDSIFLQDAQGMRKASKVGSNMVPEHMSQNRKKWQNLMKMDEIKKITKNKPLKIIRCNIYYCFRLIILYRIHSLMLMYINQCGNKSG